MHGPRAGHKFIDQLDILGKPGLEIGGQAIQIPGHGEALAAGLVDKATVGIKIHKAVGRNDAQLAVELVQTGARLVRHYEMDATVDEVLATLPRGGHAAGVGMMLKDATLVAVHLGKAAGREPGQSGADDDYRTSIHLARLSPSGPKLLKHAADR